MNDAELNTILNTIREATSEELQEAFNTAVYELFGLTAILVEIRDRAGEIDHTFEINRDDVVTAASTLGALSWWLAPAIAELLPVNDDDSLSTTADADPSTPQPE